MLAASCSCANREARMTAVENDTVKGDTALVGTWLIESVVINDTVSVHPAEVDGGAPHFIEFDDEGLYRISTGCNTISGSYSLNGANLRMGEGVASQLECENMQVEDFLRQVLPDIKSVDFVGDSVARLNTLDTRSISLHRER